MLFWEQNKQLKNCTESSCLSQIAGAIGAEYYVEGSIGQIGDRCIIALKLINADKVEIINRIIQKVYKSDNALVDEVQKIVKGLLSLQKIKSVLNKEEGEVTFTSGLDIVSEPPNVRISIDNEDRGTTPKRIEKMRSGRHTIVAKKEGYRDYSTTVNLNRGEIKPLMIKLQKKISSIYIEPKPGDVGVFFQGRRYYTPTKIENVSPGKYEIRLTSKKFGEGEATVVVTGDEEETKVVVDFEATLAESVRKYKTDNGRGYFTTELFYSIGAVSYGDNDPTTSHILQLRSKLNVFRVLLIPQLQVLATNNKYFAGNLGITLFSTQQFELVTIGCGFVKSNFVKGGGIALNLYRMNVTIHNIVSNSDTHMFIGFLEAYIGEDNYIVSLISLGIGRRFYMY